MDSKDKVVNSRATAFCFMSYEEEHILERTFVKICHIDLGGADFITFLQYFLYCYLR